MTESALAAPKTCGSAAPAVERSRLSRVVAIDALRGFALSMMALEHCSVWAKVNTLAEHYEGKATVLWKWPFWVTGLITNMAAPTFWLVAGVSVALYEAAHRRRDDSEQAITRFFLMRAGVLIALDLTVIAVLWGLATGGVYRYELDVLTSIGVSLALISVLRLLPSWALAALSLLILVSYQWILTAARPHFPDAEHGRVWVSMWLEYTTQMRPIVRFPILGWCGLMGLGVVLGRCLSSPSLHRPRAWCATSAGLLLAWLAIRLGGGYGNFVPYDSSTPLRFFLVMSKGPPSLDFILFNLAITAAAMAVLMRCRDFLDRAPLRWLVACGQASLCFYVAHHAVCPLIPKLCPAILSLGGLTRYPLIYALSMAVLIPITIAYRKVKKRRPESFLKYLWR